MTLLAYDYIFIVCLFVCFGKVKKSKSIFELDFFEFLFKIKTTKIYYTTLYYIVLYCSILVCSKTPTSVNPKGKWLHNFEGH